MCKYKIPTAFEIVGFLFVSFIITKYNLLLVRTRKMYYESGGVG